MRALVKGELRWERWEPYGNLRNATQMLSYNRLNKQCLHLANIDFSSVGSVFSGCPSGFVIRRMGRCEWMAWMWFAHETTPFIHNTSVTWVSRSTRYRETSTFYTGFAFIIVAIFIFHFVFGPMFVLG
jgi:hypothetical protein